MKLYILYGSVSTEHAVSVRSAKHVQETLADAYTVVPVYITESGHFVVRTEKDSIQEGENLTYPGTIGESIADFTARVTEDDVVFPVIHGTGGEDGTLQGLLEMLDVPYVGSNVLSSAASYSKAVTNDLFYACGVPQSAYLHVKRADYDEAPEAWREEMARLAPVVYVKPSAAGSSIGVSRVEDMTELEAALELAFRYDDEVVVEEEVEGRELQLSVWGDDEIHVSLPGEYERTGFFDYDAKYKGAHLDPIVPAHLSDEGIEKIRMIAAQAYRALHLNGFARVDIFATDDEEFFVNEVNSIPGMSGSSMTPKIWEPSAGVSFRNFLVGLIELARTTHAKKKSTQRHYE